MASSIEVHLPDHLARLVFDAIPSPAFVVDDDMRILGYNRTGGRFLGEHPESAILTRAGEVLHCIHSTEVPEGCGHAPACRDCIVRGSVNRSVAGERPTRSLAHMQLLTSGNATDISLLVTAAPLEVAARKSILLILEDVTEILTLRGLLPICANCKKIRGEEQYWHSVEEYLSSHMDVAFTHSICPDCLRKLCPELYGPDAPSE